MSRFIFRIEDDALVAKKVVNGVATEFGGEKAINKLKTLDTIKYKRTKVLEHGILLEGDRARVYICDDVLFNKDNYQNCLFHTMKKINNALKKWNKKQNEGKTVMPGVAKGVATIGILAAIGIAIVSGNLKDETYVADIAIEELNDDLNEDIINTIHDETNVVESKIIDDQIEMQNDAQIDYGVSSIDIPQDDLTTSLLNELNEADTNIVNLSFNDEFDEVKYNNVISNYYEATYERSSRWGVSTNLALSMMSQESGGYEENLMQIQWESWAEQPITIFNFEKNEYEKIVLTENPENFKNQGITQFISKEDLKNPKTNISIGCIILRYSFDQMNHNITAAIQAYNFGVNNMNKVLDAAALDLGTTRDELLNNQNDTTFLNYRDVITVGDPHYVENTLRFLQDPNETISIKYIDDFGEPQETSVIINNAESSKKL